MSARIIQYIKIKTGKNGRFYAAIGKCDTASKRHAAAAVLVLTCALHASPVFSQQERRIELNAQGILARVDAIMAYPKGLLKGLMKHIKPDGTSHTIRFTASVSAEDWLFVFSSKERGDQLKVLYNLGGEDIWVYNVHALQLFHKLGIDRFDPVLATNFTFLDLSGANLQSNYTATIEGDAVIKGTETWKLVLKPIMKGGEYGLLTLYVTKDRFLPLRIDFHDRDKAIFKFLSLVKVRESGSRVVPVRYDMMNIRQGTVTILSINEIDETASFNKELFRPEKLGE